MEIMQPSFDILTKIDTGDIMRSLELAGRTAYKSEKQITDKSAYDFVKMLISRGHESVLEHFSLSCRIICDRGITHELVRHRLASYTQESTRFCNYAKKGMTFILPPWGYDADDYKFLQACEDQYNRKIRQGYTPQQARGFLPNFLKSEIVATANLREWRHIMRVRTAYDAHPQMRQIMIPMLDTLTELLPGIFNDIVVPADLRSI